MNERDKDISDIRKERNDCARLLQRMIHAMRPTGAGVMTPTILGIRDKAANYLKRKGLEGSILR